MPHSLEGWNIVHNAEAEWVPWGANDDAKAKFLGSADGYTVTLVEANTGYQGSAHEHNHAEMFYLLDGTIRNQGETMNPGDGYAAAKGSIHSDFEALSPVSYLVIFKL